MTENQLLDLKKKVDQAGQDVSEFTGQKKALMIQLKDDWSCNSIEQLETKLKTMDSELDKINTNIEKGIEELEEKYQN